MHKKFLIKAKITNKTATMAPPTLENVFLGQDSLYSQSSLTLTTFAITSSSNKNEIQFGHDNGSLNLQYKQFANDGVSSLATGLVLGRQIRADIAAV